MCLNLCLTTCWVSASDTWIFTFTLRALVFVSADIRSSMSGGPLTLCSTDRSSDSLWTERKQTLVHLKEVEQSLERIITGVSTNHCTWRRRTWAWRTTWAAGGQMLSYKEQKCLLEIWAEEKCFGVTTWAQVRVASCFGRKDVSLCTTDYNVLELERAYSETAWPPTGM